jgi:GWxTD domain-containing protein
VGTLSAQRIIRRAALQSGQLTSRQCSAPVTVGWFHPIVILPNDWAQWSPAQLDAVLLHEREHARRRDPLIQGFALLNRAVFWFHPLAWWLERRLASLAEDACDAAVLAGGHQPAEYCGYLLSLARTVTSAGARVEIVGAAMPGAFLPQRIRRILQAGPESQITRRRLAWAVLICAGVSVAVTAATLVPAQSRAGTTMPSQSAASQPLPDHWFDDDEWHLETVPLLTPDELRAYMRVKTRAERDSFIAKFWRSHDPTPKTPANEFRREFERRIRFAKERYADHDSSATFGYQTDRGRWYVSVGPPDEVRVLPSNRGTGPESRMEEWRYKALDEFGGDVTVNFDLTSLFSCSWRGGKYRIESPAALQRFEGVSSAGAARRPFALTYPNHYVYLSFPIDKAATAMKWELRGRRQETSDLMVARHLSELLGERGPVDYVLGELGESKGREPILTHLAQYRFFESEGFACTEQLPPGRYTLSIDTTLVSGTRADSVTFEVK